jgi:hypothetical protein
MVFVEYDHMIEQFATTAANEPFRNALGSVLNLADSGN